MYNKELHERNKLRVKRRLRAWANRRKKANARLKEYTNKQGAETDQSKQREATKRENERRLNF